mgnify:CR=1 FL=1
MKKSLLVGYYGMQNTGDDALMNATAWGAKRFLGSDTITVTSPLSLKLYSGEYLSSTLTATQRFSGQNRLKSYLKAIDSNRIIFGGGSVLHNARDINLKRDLMKLSLGRNHLALGIGIGPFTDTRAEQSCKRFLNTCEFVGVRDAQSYDIAQSIAPHANVVLTFDLAPQLLNIEGFDLVPVQRKGIAVCLCPKERLSGDLKVEHQRLKNIAKVLDTQYLLTQEPVVFVSFNGHPDLGDHQIHKEVASLLSPKTMFNFVEYDSNPFRVLQRMATFKLAICMRLHASVFSYLTRTPFISLNYHPKCKQWSKQVGLSKHYSFDSESFDPKVLTNEICRGISDGFEPCDLSLNQAINLCMENWRHCYENTKQPHDFSCYSTL